MANQVVTRTYRARICNYSQVRDDLDSLGFAVLRNRRFLMGSQKRSFCAAHQKSKISEDGESERIEVVAHLRVVADAGAVGAGDDLIRHM